MSKNAIINIATGRYIGGQKRLKQSVAGMDVDFYGWTNESHVGAPPHSNNPYSFKTHAFRKILTHENKYDNVLWVDASVWAVKDVAPIFEHIQKHGYIMQEAGHHVGRWTNDRTLNEFGIARDDAMNMLMYGNAGFLGLSITSGVAMEFLNRWHNASMAGLFRGSWNNNTKSESSDDRCAGHRHDMSVGSIIANQLEMSYVSGNEWLAYANPNEPVNDKVILKACGNFHQL